MRSPHIVFFNRSYYPDGSATGQLLTELCESLVADYGCRVTVVAGVPLNAAKQPATTGMRMFTRETHRGVEILRARGTTFSKRKFAGRASNYVSYFLSACVAGQFIDRPDLVVSQTDPPILGLSAFLVSRRFNVPMVMAYQDVFPEVARLLEDFQSETVYSALRRVNCFLIRKSARVIAIGETMRARLIEGKNAAPEATVVIANWADHRAIGPAERKNPFSAKHGLDEKFVVMHSGNIGLSQSLEKVVEAAAELQDCRDIEFVFVGEGVKRADLERRARELQLSNVRFLPYQPKDELIHSFATADLFVISLKKGLAGYIVPSKLYGILASGRPFVAAVERESEVAMVAEDFDCGVVARPENASEIARQVRALYASPETRAKMGRNARTAAEKFTRESQVLAYHRAFDELIVEFPQSAFSALMKRSFDVFLSGLGLLCSSPLWLVIATAIKLEDGGPVFYGHLRVGQFGKYFKNWKFRSMIADADQKFGALQASERDPRITRVGHVLRASAMDELPQLWNIFCGDMSFVGPRALLPKETEVRGPGQSARQDEIPGYRLRTQVRPGLTGIAQVFADRDIQRRHKFRLDALYIRRQTFLLDMKLVALSFWISFRGKWEQRGAKV